jgi:23S rRNA pseudouridine1911/1915/1917 synthase
MIRNFDRQALHAVMLRFKHPATGEEMEFHAPVPEDMVIMTEALRADAQQNPMEEY